MKKGKEIYEKQNIDSRINNIIKMMGILNVYPGYRLLSYTPLFLNMIGSKTASS